MDMRTGISFLLIWIGVISVFGQQVTMDDYKRAVSFLGNNLTNKKVFNANIQPIWAVDNYGVAFVTNSPNERQFKCIERNSGKITPLSTRKGLHSCCAIRLRWKRRRLTLN
jgi:hypothetical protein